MDAVETWMTAHPILVNVILIPAISALVAWAVSCYSTRKGLENAKTERNLNKYLKLSDYHNERIISLKSDFSLFIAALGHHKQFRSAETSKELMMYCNRVLLSVDPDDSEYATLRSLTIQSHKDAMEETSYSSADLLPFAQRIAQREQARLEHSLLSSDLKLR